MNSNRRMAGLVITAIVVVTLFITYQGLQQALKFTGKLDKLTLTIDRLKLSPQDIKRLKEGQATATSGRQ